jgi:osmotically-inducible protein OsmY
MKIQEVSIVFAIRNLISRTGLAALVVCAAVACTTGPRKSDAERQADKETTDRVQLALNSDKELYARHISVRADGGVVLLGGYVWTQPELEEAIHVAKAVPGVTKVVDTMELDRSGLSNSSVSR